MSLRRNATKNGRTHCAHRWAHNEDPDKTGKTGNMSFRGMEFKSYSTVIAVKYPKKMTVIMAGDGIRNSSTTNGHKGRVRCALPPEWEVLLVDCVDIYGSCLRDIKGIRRCHDEMVKYKLAGKLEAVAQSRKGISQQCRFAEYEYYREKCNAVARFLCRKEVPAIALDDKLVGDVKELIAKREAREAAEERKKTRDLQKALLIRIAAQKENVAAWRVHEYNGSSYDLEGTFVRLSKNGKFVETSKGVVVPFADALRLFGLCRSVRAKGEDVAEIAITVGGYRVNSIDRMGNARVGCHSLSYDEMAKCFEEARAKGLVKE